MSYKKQYNQTWTAFDTQDAVFILDVRIWFISVRMFIVYVRGWTILNTLSVVNKTFTCLAKTTITPLLIFDGLKCYKL